MDTSGIKFAILGKAFLVTACAVAVTAASTAAANALISIGEGGNRTWSQAVADENVAPASNLTWAAEQFYDSQLGNGIDSFAFAVPALTPDVTVSDGAESHQSLVMSWDNDAGGDSVLTVAAWDYVYGIDPDLTGTMIHFSLFAPVGIWDVSLELIDSAGLSRGWFLPMPPNTWQNYWIDPNNLSPQSFSFFFNQPGFDITRVVAIRLNESGNNVTIPGNPGTTLPAWNAWDHLTVAVPEPGSLGLLAGAGIVLLAFRRRQRV